MGKRFFFFFSSRISKEVLKIISYIMMLCWCMKFLVSQYKTCEQ
jgi:hypothetical protein